MYARLSAFPVSRPARPTRCTYFATESGSEDSMTVDRSPMSIPISSVGVATRTLGASGEASDALKPSSILRRTSSFSRLVCSCAMTRRMSAEAYSRR